MNITFTSLEDYLNLITRNGLRECGYRPLVEVNSLVANFPSKEILEEVIHIEYFEGKDYAAIYSIKEWRDSALKRQKLQQDQALSMKIHGEKLDKIKSREICKTECISYLVKKLGIQPSQAEQIFALSTGLKNIELFKSIFEKHKLTAEDF